MQLPSHVNAQESGYLGQRTYGLHQRMFSSMTRTNALSPESQIGRLCDSIQSLACNFTQGPILRSSKHAVSCQRGVLASRSCVDRCRSHHALVGKGRGMVHSPLHGADRAKAVSAPALSHEDGHNAIRQWPNVFSNPNTLGHCRTHHVR